MKRKGIKYGVPKGRKGIKYGVPKGMVPKGMIWCPQGHDEAKGN
jgi:hypothetical protein